MLNQKPVPGHLSLQPGVIMSKDRFFESAVIAVGVISSALAAWVIFSV
jgi:hypothetical protein